MSASNPLIQSIRGMNDLFAPDIVDWQFIETTLRRVIASYGYQEIRFPIVEKTALFKRSIGEVTDIVEKEMYTFTDRKGESLTLRPEGTAGCVRACIQQGLLQRASASRFWYLGPMFRRERPQKGRCRQFHHLGAEAFGMPGSDIDAELILSTARFWRELGLTEHVNLELNSLGNTADRQRYRSELIAYFERYQNDLDEDSQRRLYTNPLRILDSKNPALRDLIQAAPKLLEYIGAEEKQHFEQLTGYLDAAGVRYTINPILVRGLDYYSHTVFEWRTTSLGAQDTVCAGGRYDNLIEQLSGKPNFAVGYAVGIERLVLLYQHYQGHVTVTDTHLVYLLLVGEGVQQHGFKLAEQIRDALPNVHLMSHCGGGSFKSQFKKADKSDARIALVLGERELAEQTIGIKWLREEQEQVTIPQEELIKYLKVVLD